MKTLTQQAAAAEAWCSQERFKEIKRLYPARDIAEQRGTIEIDYTVARAAAEGFYTRLRQLFAEKCSITTFGPYSPGQAVVMKRVGIEGIYLGGWATSAKGSKQEDPGPDLASYPLSQVPDEAATLVRALLTADKNQHFARCRMSEEQRKATPEIDFRPFIIADADTGHGGEAHVRNLVRRFVEVGVPGYHIEDQKPGAKKCGHQGGKVLVSSDEQIKRLSAARFQLDIMGVPGIIVARTDAEAATFIENRSDERDQPFILGATRTNVPSYKAGYLAIQRALAALGVQDARGHLLYDVSAREYERTEGWLKQVGLAQLIEETAKILKASAGAKAEQAYDTLESKYADLWQEAASLKTYREAVAEAIAFRSAQGESLDLSVEAWDDFAKSATLFEMRERAEELGLNVSWDDDLAKTPEGYYQVRGGIEYAIAKSLAAAPFADLIWMETKTADLEDAAHFAKAMHAKFPNLMLAYNLSPSFNWDTTGMTEEQMKEFPVELGKLGFVFNFITYGGHQVDGLASEEFASALKNEGMLALARLQRKLRLLDSPYKTPQSLVGGPRLDAGLMAVSGRTAATKAMGKGSTQFQHLVQTEMPTKVLEEWVDAWRQKNDFAEKLRADLKPHVPGSELLELSLKSSKGEKLLNIVFSPVQDRRGRKILSIRDQNTASQLRRKRLMTLAQLFLIHRYKADSLHYLTPNEDNEAQTRSMQKLGIFSDVKSETHLIILADVNQAKVSLLSGSDSKVREALISRA